MSEQAERKTPPSGDHRPLEDVEQFEQFGDRGYRNVFNRSYPRVYRAFEGFLRDATSRLTPPIRALDLGCGGGWTAERLAEMTRGSYVGIDTSRTALDRLNKALAGAESLTGAAFHRSAEWILEPAAVAAVEEGLGGPPDLLICNASCHQIRKVFADVERVLAQAAGRVRRGGVAVVGDYFYPADLDAAEVASSLAWIRRETGQNPTPPEGFFDPALLERALQRAGFEILERARFPANEHISLHYGICRARRE